MTVRIGLLGFGRTGKLVAGEIIGDADCELRWVIRKSHKQKGDFAGHVLGLDKDEGVILPISESGAEPFFAANPVDVIIDFSSHSALHSYISAAAKQGIKILSAISFYSPEELSLLSEYAKRTAVLHSPNITIGINFLLVASRMLQDIAPHADIAIVEEHFRGKNEVSGTALKIAEELGLDRSKSVNSVRVGGVVGRHEVVFGFPYQTIRLVHESISRAAFGQGAIFGAKWLVNQSAGIYSMQEVIRQKFASQFLAPEPSPALAAALSEAEKEAFSPNRRVDVEDIWFA